jgi:dTDP-4-dehydrorhamnose reductase
MKILLFGKNGQVGWELNRSLLPLGEVIALGRKEADFSNPESLRNIVREIKPDVIVNAVAYTAVDKAEAEEELAAIINSEAPGILAEEALRINALLIHYSTDYVFDGTKEGPYVESDEPNPINAYGRTKLAGEQEIQSSGCDYLILRTTWVYASRGSNFLRTILRLANERMELRIVSDQYGAPTWARNIADITGHVLVGVQQERHSGRFKSGIYHLCASGKSTWYDFADAIIEQAKILDTTKSIVTEKVLPITTEEYPLPASRPKNSQMDSSLLAARFGLTMPKWRSAMKLCIDEALE